MLPYIQYEWGFNPHNRLSKIGYDGALNQINHLYMIMFKCNASTKDKLELMSFWG